MNTILRLVVILGLQSSLLIGRDAPPKVVGAFVMVGVFERAVERFHHDVGRYPSSEEGLDVLYHAPSKDAGGWKGAYIKGDQPLDPWGSPYRYSNPAKRSAAAFDVWSLGPDGRESDDDVGNWTKL
jgi:general secretion pathway protein G